jgi:hypothetical protein
MSKKNSRKSSKRRTKAKLNKLKRREAEICGSDGIFGALSDEILLHIMSYLGPRELTKPPCMRFRRMIIDALKISTRSMCDIVPNNVRDNIIKHLFMYPVCYYYYLYYHIYMPGVLKHKFIIYKKGDRHLITYGTDKKILKWRKSKLYDTYEIIYTHGYNLSIFTYRYKFTNDDVHIICTLGSYIKLYVELYKYSVTTDSCYKVYISNDKNVHVKFTGNMPVGGVILRMNNHNRKLFV